MPSPAGDDQSRNARLQYLRAFAALCVVFYHASFYLNGFRGDARFVAVFGGYLGAYGVAVFFALSGYLMAELVTRDSPAKFLVSRLARIYPPLLLITALAALAFALVGQPRGLDAIALTLVPSGPRGYFLAVEWTLLYEMTYYVALALLAFAGLARFGAVFALIWIGVIAFAWIWGIGRIDITTPTLSELPFGAINLPFALGFLIPYAKRRNMLPRGLLAAALVTGLAGALVEIPYLRLLAGISASLFVAWAIRAGASQPTGVLGRIGLRLGDASYVLYLIHVSVFEICLILLPEATPTPLVWVIWLAAAIALSLPFGRADLALHRWLKRRIGTAPPLHLTAIALLFIAAFATIAIGSEFQVRQKKADRLKAEAILQSQTAKAEPTIRAEIDVVLRRPDGAWTIRGYGIDLGNPTLVSHIALMQNGKAIAFDAMTRMRTATAKALGRPDIGSKRFGFSLSLPADFDCRQGPVEARLVLNDGRVATVTQAPGITICP